MNSRTEGKNLAIVVILIILMMMPSLLEAGQSTIIVVDGTACMGDDKSRRQTENEALTEAKRKAAEYASTYLKSETKVKDFQLERDLVDAYARATIKILEEIEKGWYKNPSSGDCFKLKVKAEVIPDEDAMARLAQDKNALDNPNTPLHVRIWTDKKTYRQGEKIKVYLQGNKPFYARVLYKDVLGRLLQLLPNAYRKDNYFHGGVVYEIPAGNDRFELEVNPPFGEENIIVYSSLQPLGEIYLQETGGVYQVRTAVKDVATKTRGIKLKERKEGKEPVAAEFFEGKASLQTGQ